MVKKFLNYKDSVEYLKSVGIQYANILFEDSLENLFKNLKPDKMESTIYKKHGMEKIADNFAEGYVIKPLIGDTLVLADDSFDRISFKVKNKRFGECVPVKKITKKAKKEMKLSEEDVKLVELGVSYISGNRFDNVFSKFTEDEIIQKKVIGAFMADAWKDFFGDLSAELKKKAPKLRGVIMNKMRGAAMKVYSEKVDCKD